MNAHDFYILLAFVLTGLVCTIANSGERRKFCLFWILILCLGVAIEVVCIKVIENMPSGLPVRSWVLIINYIFMIILNFKLVQAIKPENDYDWIQYPIYISMAFNVLVPTSFILYDFSPTETYRIRDVFAGWASLSLCIIELVFLLVDRNGIRDRCKSIVSAMASFYYYPTDLLQSKESKTEKKK